MCASAGVSVQHVRITPWHVLACDAHRSGVGSGVCCHAGHEGKVDAMCNTVLCIFGVESEEGVLPLALPVQK